MTWRTILPAILLTSASLLAGCAGGSVDQSPQAESNDELKSTKGLKTLEGSFEVGGMTGFQIIEPQGEDQNAVAVDLTKMKIPGALLVSRPLRIRGTIEMRSAGALPNGTQILREIMIAEEIVQKTKQPATIKGELARKGAAFSVVTRTPENARPEDQSVEEIAVEPASGIEPGSLVGKKVTVLGERAVLIVGAAQEKFLINRDLVIATQIKGY